MHNEYKNSRYGKGPVPGTYALSQSSVTGNVAFGNFVGALPNGRKAKQPINNGVSPSTGAERNGAVATINSVSKLPSIWFQKGAIFNIRLSPSTLKTAEGKKRVYALVKTLFENKQYHVQFNVVGTETLLDAQKNPENYRDLMVRVAGYSAFFAPLNEDLQEDIIQRTKFDEATA
jgi:formate C-acetyltransferase